MKVLIVDDSESMAMTLTRLMEASGHQAKWVSNGTEALSMSEGWAPDAVFMDAHLGQTDGIRLAKKLRKLPQTKSSKLIIISGDPVSKARLKGLDGFVLKPASRSELLASLRGQSRT